MSHIDVLISHIRYGLLLVAAVLFVYQWFRNREEKQELPQYIASLGFEYRERLDPLEFDLYSTSFFGRFDIAEYAALGVIDGVKFVHFVQKRASGRGHNADSRAIVVFDLRPGTADRQPERCTDGFTIEVSNGRAFMWQDPDTEPDSEQDDGLDRFLARALAACQRAVG